MSSSKGKSKDVHLVNIDVTFGSLRILSNASLTLAHGRRYGVIGRNGIGKSTLLRHMALREVPIPQHISVLCVYDHSLPSSSNSLADCVCSGFLLRRYVEQEIVGDDTTALESVLQADVWRHHLLTQERELNEQLNSADVPEEEKDAVTTKLGEVQKKLIDIEAESGPARAAQLLVGLGFDVEDQAKPTRAFSGGWRSVPLA